MQIIAAAIFGPDGTPLWALDLAPPPAGATVATIVEDLRAGCAPLAALAAAAAGSSSPARRTVPRTRVSTPAPGGAAAWLLDEPHFCTFRVRSRATGLGTAVLHAACANAGGVVVAVVGTDTDGAPTTADRGDASNDGSEGSDSDDGGARGSGPEPGYAFVLAAESLLACACASVRARALGDSAAKKAAAARQQQQSAPIGALAPLLMTAAEVGAALPAVAVDVWRHASCGPVVADYE